MEETIDFVDPTTRSGSQNPWRRFVTVADSEERVETAVEALQELYDDLVDAPDDLELVFCFQDDDYDEEKLKQQVDAWLFESSWPWVVVGADRVQETCCLMLSVGSLHEVVYGG